MCGLLFHNMHILLLSILLALLSIMTTICVNMIKVVWFGIIISIQVINQHQKLTLFDDALVIYIFNYLYCIGFTHLLSQGALYNELQCFSIYKLRSMTKVSILDDGVIEST